jgi:Cu(I)/Ag(I) efflux system membrane protein CusA/SilA
VQSVVASAIGGDNVGETVEGLQRFPISNALLRPVRSTLRRLPFVYRPARHMLLGDVAAITLSDGPPCCAVKLRAAVRLGLRRWRARPEEVCRAGHAASRGPAGQADARLRGVVVGPVRPDLERATANFKVVCRRSFC